MTPRHAEIAAKRLEFDGIDLLEASPKLRRSLRGKRISMILQDPKYSLDPVMSIGRQIVETLRTHEKVGRSEARDRAMAMLEAVQIRNPSRVYDLYPHEVSGGMGQRAMIAMMLVTGPELLIADEPTSALDVTVQLDVLAILDRLVADRGMGLIFISHDLRLVSSFCDRVIVMYAGKVVEQLRASELTRAQHPYYARLARLHAEYRREPAPAAGAGPQARMGGMMDFPVQEGPRAPSTAFGGPPPPLRRIVYAVEAGRETWILPSLRGRGITEGGGGARSQAGHRAGTDSLRALRMTAALSVKNLSVVYDGHHALKNIDLEVKPGQILRAGRRIRVR